MKNPKQVSESRRKFLRDAGVSGGMAAVAAAIPGAVIAETGNDAAEQKAAQGYRLTQHILDYYKTAAS
ncbi:MAG: twin-arginine translocation signal domain-containing protein [Chromatiaceae bacterium]|nr:twin-arginine translocation signal domain-containing protein [Gammaproteobacteria bacterium]MCP5306296.1 twin-arginine translocation signal domain-containing protein [Chromatiaceae bacterium]MCP5315789.1 twin-arginine translocation signal domain-containing protein [Chromatiaceae bacterium]